MNEDKAGLIVNSIRVAVLELIGERVPIARDSLADKLEHNRRETRNVIGKGAKKDAADMVRKEV